MRSTPKRKGRICGGREMRIDYRIGWWSGLQRKSIPKGRTYGFKGSQLSHKGNDAGHKDVKSNRGLKRTERHDREGQCVFIARPG